MIKPILAAALLSSTACATAAPPPVFSVDRATVVESGGPAISSVRKSAPSKSYSKVTLSTSDGTAKSGTDYQARTVSLTFGNNELVKTVSIPIIDNKVVNPDKVFNVTIAGTRNASIAVRTAPVTIKDDDALAPPPSPLTGEQPIADNFNSASGIVTTGGVAPISTDQLGGFRFFCSAGQLLKDDPIAFPGQPGASHLHQFIGNTGANASSTYASLRTTGGTTCGQSSTPLNRSSYWMPAMLDGAGDAVKPDHVLVYYKRIPNSNPACGAPDATHVGVCTDLPNGIRFIFGYNMKTMTGGPTDGWEQWFMNYQCWGAEDGSIGSGTATGTYQTLAATAAAGCPVGARLHLTLEAPTCWDGLHLDVADHRSHVVYATGDLIAAAGHRACPADHPYVIPIISYQWFFTVDANFVKWHLSSDEMIPGIAAGTTLHMDYFEAWSPYAKPLWQQNCINGHLTCSSGDLGNATGIAGMGVPAVGWPKHILAPLP